jgi:hypothetical protein
MTAYLDLKGARQGNTFRRTFAFRQANGDAVDLTASTVVVSIKYGPGRNDILRFTTEDGTLAFTDADPETGSVVLVLDPDDTQRLPAGRATKYEVERQVTDGDQTTLLYGLIDVQKGWNDD